MEQFRATESGGGGALNTLNFKKTKGTNNFAFIIDSYCSCQVVKLRWEYFARRRSRVVSDAPFRCRKPPEGHEIAPKFRHSTTAKFCQPNSVRAPFSNRGRTRQQKERDGLRLLAAMRKIQWTYSIELQWLEY